MLDVAPSGCAEHQGAWSPQPSHTAATRRLIVDAARGLFARYGYGATSIAQITSEAGVAVPTIYASVGTNLHLLELLNNRIEEDAGVGGLIPRLVACQDAHELVRLQTQLSRRLSERAAI